MRPEDAERIAAVIRPHYLKVRVLPDGTIAALGELITTRAIFLDCDQYGWGSRFCFRDRTLALQRFCELQSCDDEPAGYVARRPERASA